MSRLPLNAIDGKLYGNWSTGPNCASGDYYGAFPGNILKRITTLYPEKPRLHLFSGSLKTKEESVFTSDIDSELSPDICCNAEFIHKNADKKFQTVIADPPYNKAFAKNYTGHYPNKGRTVYSCSKILRPGGTMLWMDIRCPQYRSKDGWQFGGYIGIYTGTNKIFRAVFVLHKLKKMENYLTIEEAAKKMDRCKQTIRSYVRKGKLKSIEIQGKYYIPKKDIYHENRS